MLSLHLGILVVAVEVALAYLRWHSASRLLYLFLCKCGAEWEVSIFAIWSKYPTQASDQLMACWDSLKVSSLCHRSQIDANCLLFFEPPRSASFALWWCSCHKLRPCLYPLALIEDVRKHGAFRTSKAALIRRIISRSGLMWNRHTTFLPILDPETSNVLVGTSCRMSWHLRHSKYNYHHSFSIQCHWTLTWRWSGPWSILAWCSLSPSRSGSREEEIMTKILRIIHSNSVGSPSSPTASWYDEYFSRSSTWPFHLSVAPAISFTCPTRTESA